MLLYYKNRLFDGSDGFCALNQNEETHNIHKTNRIDLIKNYQNASIQLEDAGLIYEAIQLAQQKNFLRWTWQYDQAENHPAILKLCALWNYFQKKENKQTKQNFHAAFIPDIQVFLGENKYIPILPDAVHIPLTLKNNNLHEARKNASIILGENFLITFLAGRYLTSKLSVSLP